MSRRETTSECGRDRGDGRTSHLWRAGLFSGGFTSARAGGWRPAGWRSSRTFPRFLRRPRSAPVRRSIRSCAGVYDGRACRIEPHLDGMAVRKLPVLWLFVTVEAAIPKPFRLSAMMRPSNLEYWSPASELDEIARPDPSLPDRLIVRAGAGNSARSRFGSGRAWRFLCRRQGQGDPDRCRARAARHHDRGG